MHSMTFGNMMNSSLFPDLTQFPPFFPPHTLLSSSTLLCSAAIFLCYLAKWNIAPAHYTVYNIHPPPHPHYTPLHPSLFRLPSPPSPGTSYKLAEKGEILCWYSEKNQPEKRKSRQGRRENPLLIFRKNLPSIGRNVWTGGTKRCFPEFPTDWNWSPIKLLQRLSISARTNSKAGKVG